MREEVRRRGMCIKLRLHRLQPILPSIVVVMEPLRLPHSFTEAMVSLESAPQPFGGAVRQTLDKPRHIRATRPALNRGIRICWTSLREEFDEQNYQRVPDGHVRTFGSI